MTVADSKAAAGQGPQTTRDEERAPGDRLSGSPSVSLEELDHRSFVRTALDDILLEVGLEQRDESGLRVRRVETSSD